MAEKSPMQRKEESERRRAWILIVVTAAVLIVGVVLWVLARGQAVPLNATSLCPEKREPSVYWAVLVDATESYTSPQKASIKKHFEDLKADVPQYGKLAVYVVDDREAEALDHLASLCNPGRGSGASWLTQNPLDIEKKWKDGFDGPLTRILDEIIEGADARYSPIMEKIQAISITAFPRKTTTPRRIIIISDMLQHTPDHSHYTTVPDFKTFERTPAYRKVWTDLKGVEIDILYVNRHGAEATRIQGRRHVDFWEAYFDSMRGMLKRVTRVEG